jgi:hypothetical protein
LGRRKERDRKRGREGRREKVCEGGSREKGRERGRERDGIRRRRRKIAFTDLVFLTDLLINHCSCYCNFYTMLCFILNLSLFY